MSSTKFMNLLGQINFDNFLNLTFYMLNGIVINFCRDLLVIG